MNQQAEQTLFGLFLNSLKELLRSKFCLVCFLTLWRNCCFKETLTLHL